MSAYLLIDSHAPGLSNLIGATKVAHDTIGVFNTNADIDSFVTAHMRRKGYKTVGLLFDNIANGLPNFGHEKLTHSAPLFTHFLQKVKEQGVTTVDLITCDVNHPKAIENINHIRSAVGINIRYSIDSTGGAGNWILESHGADIRALYFNEKINEYKYILGGSNNHSGIVFRTSSGTLTKVFGHNNNGQLGDNTTSDKMIPSDLSSFDDLYSLMCGGGHTVFGKYDPITGIIELYSTGLNSNGQLGLGNTTSITSPMPITVPERGGANAQCNVGGPIACGNNHTVFLESLSGLILSFGDNTYGQLGLGDTTQRNAPVSISNENVNAGTIQRIVCGASHTIFHTTDSGSIDSRLLSCGRNNYGQLGLGLSTAQNMVDICEVVLDSSKAIYSIACGSEHTAIVYQDMQYDEYGTYTGADPSMRVATFGNNMFGQLGNGTMENWSTTPIYLTSISNAQQVACGENHTVVLLADGTVKAFGDNTYGQLGDGTNTTRSSPVTVLDISNATGVSCGANHTHVILLDGRVMAFGRNNYGQLGDGTTTNRSTPVYVRKTTGGLPVTAGVLLYNSLSIGSTGSLSVTIASVDAVFDGTKYDLAAGLSLELQVGSTLIPEKYTLNYIVDGGATTSVDLLSTDTSYTFLSPASGTYDIWLEAIYGYSDLDLSSEVDVVIGGGGGGGVPCFLAGTRVLTPTGYKLIESFKEGDVIMTSDGRIVPVELKLTKVSSTTEENAPYIIPKNLFKTGFPTDDVAISPNHAIQVKPKVWLFPKNLAQGSEKVKQIKIGEPITYYHIEAPNYLSDNMVVEGMIVETYGRKEARKVGYLFSEKVGGYVRVYRETSKTHRIRIV